MFSLPDWRRPVGPQARLSSPSSIQRSGRESNPVCRAYQGGVLPQHFQTFKVRASSPGLIPDQDSPSDSPTQTVRLRDGAREVRQLPCACLLFSAVLLPLGHGSIGQKGRGESRTHVGRVNSPLPRR